MEKGYKVKQAWVNSPQAVAVAEYYVQGHSVRETAEKFGVPTYQVNNLAKRSHLTNGRDWRTASVENNKNRAEQRLIYHLDSLGFDYLEGYDNKKSSVKIKCRKCGYVFTRTVEFLQTGNVICRECRKQEALKRKKREETVRQEETETKKQRAEAEKADALFHLLNDSSHVCCVCGKYFSISEFMESKGLALIPTQPRYCSKECEKKHNHRKSKECKQRRGVRETHRHRAKKYGCNYDPSVTLPRLIKRDGFRCAICGENCDPNDHSWSEYSGPNYPSIDHIIPMSKGGGHTWDNVQIAHIICNSNKSDKVVSK